MKTFRIVRTLVLALAVGLAVSGCGKEEGKGEAGEGKAGKDLGTLPIGAYSVQVSQQSDYTAGGKTKYFIKPTGGQGQPTAIRAWVGSESAEGSLKAKAAYDAADGDYDATVEIPATPPADAKLWVEVEDAGKREKASFPAHK